MKELKPRIHDDSNGLDYVLVGDYYLPNIALSDTMHYHIGKYGRMRRTFLQEHRPIQFSDLVLTEKLFLHLAEIDEACHNRLDVMIPAMAEQEGVTAALKRADQMEVEDINCDGWDCV